MAFKFPFTNYHELNLDWILKKLGELFEASAENVETIKTYEGRLTTVEGEVVTIGGNADQALQIATGAQSLAETAQQTGQQALAYAQTAQSTAAGAINASSTAIQESQTARQEAQQAIYIAQNTSAQLNDQIEALQTEAAAQMQAIDDRADAAIDEIETTVADVIASIPSDYSDLSNDVSNVKNALIKFNAYNLIADGSVYTSREHRGVTYTWDANKQNCTVIGTSTGLSFANIYSNTTSTPLTAGKTYHVEFESTDSNIAVEVVYHTVSGDTPVRLRSAGDITIPANTAGLTVRLRVLNGVSVDGIITWYGIFDAYSNQELSEFMDSNKGGVNTNAHMFSICNSILTGSVWINGAYDHLSSYENSPYGNVAIALNVPQKNVNHMLLSNTGLISDAGQGSFLTNIKATDLSGYDYLLTHFWYNDMSASKPLGDQTATAGDGTVAGGVVELVEYIKTNNGQCKLILVSIPPYTGTENVFDLKYDNGKSIRDLDVLMHRLANLYHFVYIDWQQLALSYYYQDYTDDTNVHANNETTYRAMGEYLAMNIRNEGDVQDVDDSDILNQPGVTFISRTNRGVTFTWTGRKCHVYGTATDGKAFTNLYYNETALPDNVSPRDYVYLRFNQRTTSGVIGFEMYVYDAERTIIATLRYTTDRLIKIPDTAAGIVIRIYVNDGVTVDGDVTVLQLVKVKKKSPDIPLIVSFIDDDTSGQDYVEKYYYACKHNGVKGNYAVMTYQLGVNVQTETLLGYEDEGFGMLTHCYRQSPTITPYWSDDNRTEEVINQCRANLARGLREMREHGFVNYNHFVIPGGHTYPDLVSSARMLGVETAISTANGTWNNFADYDRYFIKRISFEPDDSNPARTMQVTKDLIDSCATEGVGWLILTTHFNEWGGVTWDDTLDTSGNPIGYSRFNEIVQYALNSGFTPMNYCEAWTYFKSLFDQNRQTYNQIEK